MSTFKNVTLSELDNGRAGGRDVLSADGPATELEPPFEDIYSVSQKK